MRMDYRRNYRGIRWTDEYHIPLIKAINYQNQIEMKNFCQGTILPAATVWKRKVSRFLK